MYSGISSSPFRYSGNSSSPLRYSGISSSPLRYYLARSEPGAVRLYLMRQHQRLVRRGRRFEKRFSKHHGPQVHRSRVQARYVPQRELHTSEVHASAYVHTPEVHASAYVSIRYVPQRERQVFGMARPASCVRQCWYFRTSKASKLSTLSALRYWAWRDPRVTRVSICTSVLVKRAH